MWLYHCVLGHCIKGDLSPLIWYIKIMSLYGVISYHVTISEGHMVDNHPIYGVINYHVTLSEGHIVPHLVATLIYLSQNYSYYIRGDRSPLIFNCNNDFIIIHRIRGLYVHCDEQNNPHCATCLFEQLIDFIDCMYKSWHCTSYPSKHNIFTTCWE